MTRYSAMFDRCRAKGEGALGAFLMLGDPDWGSCLAYLDSLVAGGADMIELGIPFSDPVADGPVIQAAAERALRSGCTTADCLAMIAEFRSRHPAVPVGVLTYANIVAARGIGRFCDGLAEAGADSLLVADVPTMEAAPYKEACRTADIDLVMIAATNTPDRDLERIAATGSGYTYCVTRAGVTGAGLKLDLGGHGALIGRLERHGAAPAVLGFGIGTPDQVRDALGSGAAGAIVGSAIVDRIANQVEPRGLQAFVQSLKQAARARPRPFPLPVSA